MTNIELNIVYGNHINPNHLTDLAEIAYSAFKNSRAIESITFSKHPIKERLNLIIEEFSDADFCEKLILLKRDYPKTKFILIITEIPTDFSYNTFNKYDNLISKHIYNSLLNNIDIKSIRTFLRAIYLEYLKKFHPFFKTKSIFFDYKNVKGNLTLKVLNKLYKVIFKKSSPYFFKFLYYRSDLIYFVIRFINTKKLISLNLFDKIYIINESSRKIIDLAFQCESKEFPYYIQPKAVGDKTEVFMFSGNLTQERVEIIKKIEAHGFQVGLNPDFNDLGRRILYERSMFSIQISRYLNGNFSSPTRTINALAHGVIPIPLTMPLYSTMEQDLSLPILSDALKMLSESNIEDRNNIMGKLYVNHMHKIFDAVESINKRSYEIINADLFDIYR